MKIKPKTRGSCSNRFSMIVKKEKFESLEKLLVSELVLLLYLTFNTDSAFHTTSCLSSSD